MSIADQIGPHLPYLRRYARALTGQQSAGDTYVAAALETLVSEPKQFDTTLPPRVAIYRLLSRVWNTVPLNQALPIDADIEATKAERNLEAISPKPRQAFLLCSVEGFNRKEAASILDVSDADVGSLLTQAGEELAKQLSADILIIEDEPLVAEDLEATIRDIGHRPTGVARTHKEALALVAAKRPSLVMADIHLADGSSGIDAVDDILKSMSVPVIFVTGHPEVLLTGTKPEPVFLLPKPFDPAMLKALISQALFFGVASTRSDKHAA